METVISISLVVGGYLVFEYWFKVKRIRDNSPFKLDLDQVKTHVLHFRYGESLSDDPQFKIHLHMGLRCRFLDCEVYVEYVPELKEPTLDTSKRNKSKVWQVIHEVLHDASAGELSRSNKRLRC